MVRFGTVLGGGFVGLLGLTTFMVTYSVQGLEDDLLRVQRQTAAEQQEIRVLDAEWTYLTKPGRLEELNQRFLALAPVSPQQLSRNVAEIPLRPTEPPAAGAATGQPNAGEARLAADTIRPPAPERAGAPPETSAPTVKPTLVKSATRPPTIPATHSLDDLFAQVAGER
jgi:hypothetical protein